MHVAVKIVRIPTVADDVASVPILFVEAQRHTVYRRIHGELAGMHHFGRLRLQDGGSAIFPILQVSDHEPCHVSARD